jgi:hypothetical protein
MVMLDYIQHTRPKCKHCTINVNGRLIKHKSYYDTSNREYDKEAERFKLLHYDTVNVTDLSFKGYEISGFGTINFISETSLFEDVYHFTPVVLDKVEKIIYCQLLRNDIRYLFIYNVIGDTLLLSHSTYMEDGY